MIKNTKLSFSVIDTHSCHTFGIADLSYYNPLQEIKNATLQVITPFDDEAVEVRYNKNSITILNSNNLKITNVLDTDNLVELPDGLYTAKMSICPEDQFYFEKSWFRTCQLECKYNKALLKLDISECSTCFDKDKLAQLQRTNIYIQGIKANVENCNIAQAKKLYSAASKILENILNCNC